MIQGWMLFAAVALVLWGRALNLSGKPVQGSRTATSYLRQPP